jgi:RimJ/RimL family protein N-acetyltransferase
VVTLSTARLRLIAATAAMARAELRDVAEFAALVACEVPTDWPPPLNDIESMTWYSEYLVSHPGAEGWAKWYFARPQGARFALIGNGGFKGAPSPDGTVEIGYSIVPAQQRKGFASEAVDALIGWAFQHPQVRRVIAHTFPDLRASISVLRRNGFTELGAGPAFEPGTIQFERRRS